MGEIGYSRFFKSCHQIKVLRSLAPCLTLAMPRARHGKEYCNACDDIFPAGHSDTCAKLDDHTPTSDRVGEHVTQLALLEDTQLPDVFDDNEKLTEEDAKRMFFILVERDQEFQRRADTVTTVLKDWGKDGIPTAKPAIPTLREASHYLQEQQSWMRDSVMRLVNARLKNDSTNIRYSKSIITSLESMMSKIDHRLSLWNVIPEPENSYTTGTCIHPTDCAARLISMGLSHPLNNSALHAASPS